MTSASYYLVGAEQMEEPKLKIFAIVQTIDKFGIYREIKAYDRLNLNEIGNKMIKQNYPFFQIAYVSMLHFLFIPIHVLNHFYLKETNPVNRYRIPIDGELNNIIHEYISGYDQYGEFTETINIEISSIDILDDLSPSRKRIMITPKNPEYLSLMYRDSLRRKHGIEPETNNPLGVII